MNFKLTEEQKAMQKMVRDFAENEVEPFVEKMENGEFPTSLLQKMGELGLMGIPIPTCFGGAGKDFISYIIAIHEISKISAALGVILSVHTSVGTLPIFMFGTEEQKEKYLKKLATGKSLAAFCLTEANAGSDVAKMATRAMRKETCYEITGAKQFITNGGEANTYIVFAKTNQSKGNRGISAFIVDKETDGFSFGHDEQKMGLHGSRTVQLLFDEAKVPLENLLGNEGDGFKMAMSVLDGGRIGIAAQALGIAEAALHVATNFLKKRSTESQLPIEQGVAFKLADMATKVKAAELLVYQAAYLKGNGLSCGKQAAIAKLFASKTAMENASEAVQLLGDEGYTDKFPAERYFRDAKVCEIYEGTSEIQRIVISKHLLKS